MPPHFFHTLETIMEYPEEEKKMAEKYKEDECIDRLREMTPSKSLKEEKKNMKMRRKSLGKDKNTIGSNQIKNLDNMENSKPVSWIPKMIGKLSSRIEEQKDNLALSAALSANSQIIQQQPQNILPLLNISQPAIYGHRTAPIWLSFAATPSTYGLPALGSFGTFVPPPFSPFVGFRTKYEEAVAHTRICGLYTQKPIMGTKYNYIFNPSGSPHLPQLVEKSSPTTRTLFKRWMEKHKCSAGDIEQKWEHMDETARRGWEDLARCLRRERKNQLDRKYITVNRVNL
ncbi:hypothetical protein CAEBREN_23902 [Caenorhabditis brenneri]|uniref:Uncharacterized protein n=1 Tax=Caenorhabditis brenneri TaxID=135651 RepID=G0MMT2_CAEBE|nr:hypothetical protein CAEBREN_23902 [Caenorhabditis brenneri]